VSRKRANRADKGREPGLRGHVHLNASVLLALRSAGENRQKGSLFMTQNGQNPSKQLTALHATRLLVAPHIAALALGWIIPDVDFLGETDAWREGQAYE
jgi:hypothetical protein